MSVSPLLRKVFLVDLVKGLSVTFHNQSEKERITEQYPLERPVVVERYRGQPRLNVNPDTGESLCIVCNLCALACPEQLIVVKGERNPVTKRKALFLGRRPGAYVHGLSVEDSEQLLDAVWEVAPELWAMRSRTIAVGAPHDVAPEPPLPAAHAPAAVARAKALAARTGTAGTYRGDDVVRANITERSARLPRLDRGDSPPPGPRRPRTRRCARRRTDRRSPRRFRFARRVS